MDQVLYNDNGRLLFRGLTLGDSIKEIPEQIPLNRVMSLTLHETASFNTLKYCLELRSLKLIGGTEWITWIIKNISQRNTKLHQLTVITPTIKFLSDVLTSILSMCSLRRLELRTEEITESAEVRTIVTTTSNIEQFIIDSNSTIDWKGLSRVLPNFARIRYLSISLIDHNQTLIPSLFLHNLESLSIALLEMPFDCIIQLVTKMSCLVKLKITGLVDADGFVVNQRWTRLFETVPTLLRILVHVSLEQRDISYHCEKIQVPLHALNLSLVCDTDETDYYLYYGNVNRWWSLSGIIIKYRS